eukprot:TRINITY_DN5731_c0_g2_i1.p1 TRINITY_DN5731_c0_g2~~TRINITY_DN5731_c0_g2_i1.p1  ORF type:complete len:328 (-),score=59.71 TRINITY_DN5731_c0_g2_i1:178-1161(-)
MASINCCSTSVSTALNLEHASACFSKTTSRTALQLRPQFAGVPLAASSRSCRSHCSRSQQRLTVRASSERKNVESSARELALSSFRHQNAFKVIAGLQNFNAESVASIVKAADQGGATLVDIACDPDLVRLALSLTNLPICVSAVEPELFVPAVEAGAHMVEIGNFDSFYKDGRVFSAEEVLELTRRTRELLPTIALSVTVPHTLPLDEQVSLAEALQEYADIIQTEGGTSSAPSQAGIAGLIEKAVPTLAATYAIAQAVSIPVMSASGISSVTTPMAFAAGASGIGVGSAINKMSGGLGMIASVRAIADAVPVQRSAASPLSTRTA